jgi:hypothetical protein
MRFLQLLVLVIAFCFSASGQDLNTIDSLTIICTAPGKPVYFINGVKHEILDHYDSGNVKTIALTNKKLTKVKELITLEDSAENPKIISREVFNPPKAYLEVFPEK